MELNYTEKIKELIDNLKARCNSAGLGGDGNEYKVITQSFLYKFLNDKFLHDIINAKPELANATNITESLESMSENDYNILLARLGGNSAKLKPEHLITTLFNRQNESEFHKLFNDTLHDIAVMNTGTFSVHTDEGTDVLLFDNELFNSVSDSSKRNSLARAVINLLANEKLDFSMAFDQGFDFFSTIFEYMIKDYNANGGGVYAEYYTPRSVARIMADILVGDEKPENVKILDPSAGSGTLLMSIAHKIGSENCSIYSQDISQKSSNLLRLNLILNNLAHSISHVVEGNTITHPAHQNIVKDEGFDYIVSNPPFKLDFSEYRDEVANSEANAERFFAGVPTIPNKKKESMAIYLLFIQHIMHSLGEHGKAAVVVPTGFITAQSGIEKAIRERLV
ncbi:MAG: N-6 DNA methylase, partial [Candidatus Saccharibacteria bacterium]|nr:N-6 DNA methylase [Candidatus Saccharibacteria bacterium]